MMTQRSSIPTTSLLLVAMLATIQASSTDESVLQTPADPDHQNCQRTFPSNTTITHRDPLTKKCKENSFGIFGGKFIIEWSDPLARPAPGGREVHHHQLGASGAELGLKLAVISQDLDGGHVVGDLCNTHLS